MSHTILTPAASRVLAQEWRDAGNNSDTENAMYSYAYRAYMPDTHAIVYDPTESEYVFTERYSEDEAHEWMAENGTLFTELQRRLSSVQSDRNYYAGMFTEASSQRYNAQNKARVAELLAFTVARFLGTQARSHAIDNSLCENYERFLENVIRREINNPSELLDNNNEEHRALYGKILSTFYVSATRTRQAVVSVGRHASAYITSESSVGSEVNATVTAPSRYEQTTLVSTSELTYDDARKANLYAIDNGWTRGHGAFTNDDESDETPPRDGEERDGRTWCSDCEAWHENN